MWRNDALGLHDVPSVAVKFVHTKTGKYTVFVTAIAVISLGSFEDDRSINII